MSSFWIAKIIFFSGWIILFLACVCYGKLSIRRRSSEGNSPERSSRKLDLEPPLLDCIQSMDMRCDIECCGIDAFDPIRNQIKRWRASRSIEDVVKARAQVESLITQLQDSSSVWVIDSLNAWTHTEEDRKQLMDFLAQFRDGLELPGAGSTDSLGTES